MADPWKRRVTEAGFTMKTAKVGDVAFSYAEGPDNGPSIGEPAYVTGNSSGGLLTVWLAANRPGLVRSVVLEDPPLFAAEYPRIKTTIADRSFATCAAAVRKGVDDFLLFWIDSNKAFFTKTRGTRASITPRRSRRSPARRCWCRRTSRSSPTGP